jgi:hypothetical protein
LLYDCWSASNTFSNDIGIIRMSKHLNSISPLALPRYLVPGTWWRHHFFGGLHTSFDLYSHELHLCQVSCFYHIVINCIIFRHIPTALLVLKKEVYHLTVWCLYMECISPYMECMSLLLNRYCILHSNWSKLFDCDITSGGYHNNTLP